MAAITPPLTEQELGFSFNPALRRTTAFLGLCIGFFVGRVAFVIYASVAVWLQLPRSPTVMFTMFGIFAILGAVIGFLTCEKYRDISVKFNSDYLKLYRDGILKQQIAWSDVEKVKPGYEVLAKNGETIRIPALVLSGQSHEVRSLANQLKGLVDKETTQPERWIWGGLVAAIIGGGIVVIAPKPPQIFAAQDPHLPQTWLQLLPFILSSCALLGGFLCFAAGLQLLAARKKPHPFVITPESISKGKRSMHWEDVQQVNRRGSQDLTLELKSKAGMTWVIDGQLYADGVQLRDAILAYSPKKISSPAATPSAANLKGNTWEGQRGSIVFLAILTALFGILAFGSLAFGWIADRDTGKPTFGYAASALALLLFGILDMIVYRVELLDGNVTRTGMLGTKKQMGLTEVASVQLKTIQAKERMVDTMTLENASTKFTFASSMSNYAEIRDAILQTVPPNKVKIS